MSCTSIIRKPSFHQYHGKTVFRKTGPWCQKGWGPLLYMLRAHKKHHFLSVSHKPCCKYKTIGKMWWFPVTRWLPQFCIPVFVSEWRALITNPDKEIAPQWPRPMADSCCHPRYRNLWWVSGKEYTCRWWILSRCWFNPWVRKVPWRRKWQATPVFLPGKSHGQRSLMELHRVAKSWRRLSMQDCSMLHRRDEI